MGCEATGFRVHGGTGAPLRVLYARGAPARRPGHAQFQPKSRLCRSVSTRLSSGDGRVCLRPVAVRKLERAFDRSSVDCHYRHGGRGDLHSAPSDVGSRPQLAGAPSGSVCPAKGPCRGRCTRKLAWASCTGSVKPGTRSARWSPQGPVAVARPLIRRAPW